MNSKEIRSKISKLLTDQQAIALRGFDSTNRSAFDKMQKEVETLEEDFNRVSAMEQRDAERRSFTPSPRGNVGNGHNINGDETRSLVNAAFRTYARHGIAGLNAEQRDLLTTSDATGGALIPVGFEGILHEAIRFYGPIAGKVAQKKTDSNGAPLKISLTNDTSNGLTLLATEGVSSPAETDPTFLSKTVGTDTLTGGLVKISFQEMADSAFDLDNAVRQFFSVRYGRGLERAVTLGVDSAGTTLPNFSAGGILGSATLGTTTAAISGGIGWTDLVQTLSALDPAYQPNASFVMSAATRSYLISLKDGFGKPYFTPDPSNDAPLSKLLGFPICLNQAMPSPLANAFTANQIPILFGDLEKSYLLRTDGQPSILRLNERYADTLEIGFYLFSRAGGTSLNAGVSPIVSLKIAAS